MSKKIISLLLIVAFIPLISASPVINSSYDNPTYNVDPYTRSVDFSESTNIRIEQTKYEPYPAEPGQYVTVWIAIQNWGEKEIKDAYFKLAPDYPFKLEPGKNGVQKISKITGGGQYLLEYNLIANEGAIEGKYKMDLKQCTNENCSDYSRTKEIQISVKTGGSPRIRVGLEESPTFSAGKNGEVTLNIVNRGKLDVKFLTLYLLPSNEYEILSPSEEYLGELESDDFETADFKIFMKENVAKSQTKNINIPVKVEYTDSNNKDYEEQAQVKLKVYSENDLERFGLAKNGQSTNIYLVLGLVLAGAIYWFYRRKNKH